MEGVGWMANRREALKGAVKFFGGDELAARVWVDKYALKDQDGDFQETSPEHTYDRLLRYFPDDNSISESIRNGWFIPAGRILFAMGNPFVKATQLNCYVIPIKQDSLESIFECAKEMARTYSYGGGCGIDIGSLRPGGSSVNNTAITSSGSVSFMDFFSKVTGTVGQHGRRGALMITIPVDHPDAPQFLNIKDDLDPSTMSSAGKDLRNYIYNRRSVGHANISIKLTDEFLEAVEKGSEFHLRWESEDGEIKSESTVDARQYWRDICHQAWKQAEPGLLFWDKIVKESPSDQYRFRRIGLGVMGFGEMTASLGITYGGEGFQEFAESLFERIRDEAYGRSAELAEELGPFPAFDWEKHSKCPFIQRLPKRISDSIAEHGLRNVTVVSFAPTGTIAILGQTSGGMEPMFAPL